MKRIMSILFFVLIVTDVFASVHCQTGGSCPDSQYCHEGDCCTEHNGEGTCTPQP